MKKSLFIKAELRSVSPLSIGCGLSEFTDNDVLLGADGRPYIPGTSVAGVCRHYLLNNGFSVYDLFGSDKNTDESRIIFYNCSLTGDFCRNFRDGVKIGDDGTAQDTGKFDYEIIDFADDSSFFTLRIEIENYKDEDKPLLDAVLAGFKNGEIRLGHKTNRGFGRFALSDVRSLMCENVNDLLAFDWAKVTNPYEVSEAASNYYSQTEEFAVRSFVMVAYNATNELKYDKTGIINSDALKNAKEKNVIPGTSWAGVFRHHFKKILTESGRMADSDEAEEYLGRLFGSTSNTSMIIFDESEIYGSRRIQQTRNAIDRFTGGACDKKLFTNQISFGGKLTLSVHVKPGLNGEDMKLCKNLIALTLADLEDGSLNIGGLGSVGGGMLRKAGK